MAQRCIVCHHAERDRIDRRLMEGAGGRAIAREFGVSSRSVDRHRVNHLCRAVARAAAVTGAVPSATQLAASAPDPTPLDFLGVTSIAQDLHRLHVMLSEETDTARAAGARGQFLQSVDRLLAVLQQRARLGGVAPANPVVSVGVTIDTGLAERLLARVGANPEARAALAQALLQEAGP